MMEVLQEPPNHPSSPDVDKPLIAQPTIVSDPPPEDLLVETENEDSCRADDADSGEPTPISRPVTPITSNSALATPISSNSSVTSVEDDEPEYRPSLAAQEWEKSKTEDSEDDPNDVVDELMKLKGLEEVKQQFLDIMWKVEVCKKQERELNTERFNVVFQGNPGTGKTTVARLYARFLESIGVLESDTVKETSGITVAVNGAADIENEIDNMLRREDGGVLFIDEAYQLTAPYVDGGGRRALDVILTKIENNIGKLVVIFVGYKDEMESFFEHNPGLTSRIPYNVNFADFTDWELWKILADLITSQYNKKMTVEGGMDGLYMRIAIRRLAQGRGRRGFGNARAVENLLARISGRQAKRLAKEKRARRQELDYFHFTKEDLIGPEPSEAARQSEAWTKLQALVGLEQVKERVKRFIGMIKRNYDREMIEKEPLRFSLNQLFVGAPGTGKTTVAGLYGRILADLGYLSRGDVVMKNPADFIGECLGKSEAKTKKILDNTVGKVLVIDEAYMLDAGDPGREQDKFKTGVIDTLVSIIQGVPGEDRCVILVGYEDKIKTMFRNVNVGLSRRFPIESPFRFENFNVSQLRQILYTKMQEEDMSCTPEAMDVAGAMFERALMRPNFTNAGEVNSCLQTAKLNWEQRLSSLPSSGLDSTDPLIPNDFDPEWDRGSCYGQIEANLKGRVHDDIVNTLVTYQKRYNSARQLGLDPRSHVPTNIVFKGFPGTGKTTTAQQMGKVFYGMGFLSTSEVIECSAGDLFGEYVGHTTPKTRQKLEEARGRVLFIDEAYRFVGGQYALEALDELIHFLTQPTNAGKMVVVLAGYTEEINALMALRPVLSGLFKEEIVFENIPLDDCVSLLARELTEDYPVFGGSDFLTNRGSEGYTKIKRLFHAMQVIPSWSNARDIKHLAKQILGKYLESHYHLDQTQTSPLLSIDQVVQCMAQMIMQQSDRWKTLGKGGNNPLPLLQPPLGANEPGPVLLNPQLAQQPPPKSDSAICTPGAGGACSMEGAQADIAYGNDTSSSVPISRAPPVMVAVDVNRRNLDTVADYNNHHSHIREDGASDAEWESLIEARKAENDRVSRRETQIKDLRKRLDEIATALRNTALTDAERDSLIAEQQDIERNLTSFEEQKRQERQIQQALRQAKRCVYGYAYTREAGGYRCEGGTHFISDSDVQALLG
ncbi:P-loop containing nucleoside triphosphate hydrolase protein [Hypomontagnella monticulosa]|nr:P-loop containing nucleoside triphosphate hydrolase protein [Hypomontagnella monticulosa]